MLNKLDIKNFDKVVGAFNFKELIEKEKAEDLAHSVYNKVRYEFLIPYNRQRLSLFIPKFM
jgi:hypothetical protein